MAERKTDKEVALGRVLKFEEAYVRLERQLLGLPVADQVAAIGDAVSHLVTTVQAVGDDVKKKRKSKAKASDRPKWAQNDIVMLESYGLVGMITQADQATGMATVALEQGGELPISFAELDTNAKKIEG